MLTLTITLAMWGFLRALDPEETRPRLWAGLMAAGIGAGLLLKGLIAVLFPVGAMLCYFAVTGQLFSLAACKRLYLPSGILIALLLAAPWHVMATLRNPPYLDFTMRSEPGHYRGFFWFYFLNEHVLRFLNLRYPRDYNTVPRVYFWLFHLLWLFPWSVYLPGLARLEYTKRSRAGRMRLLALCWTGFVLVFFTFSTTQEYYSMPVYPALALLLGCALEQSGSAVRNGTKFIGGITALCAAAAASLLFLVRALPAPGDISQALTRNPEAYTLSLGHMGDLTIASFAYLRLPLSLAALAFVIGAVSAFCLREYRAYIGLAVMMVVFFQAARLALVVFDPYLSSRALAEALKKAPEGQVIFDDQYYTFSSVFFYTGTRGLLLNGRVNNLEYGSNAPGAPQVFIDDSELQRLWRLPERQYLLVEGPSLPRIEKLVGAPALHTVAESGGKYLLSNLKP
jgi:4-amino-4-deoxy-L-arabinose transferase-like glycosyltransferase